MTNAKLTEYVIKDGDTLQMIAKEHLKDSTQWIQIALYNNLEYPYIVGVNSDDHAEGFVKVYRESVSTANLFDITIPIGTVVKSIDMNNVERKFITTNAYMLPSNKDLLEIPVVSVGTGRPAESKRFTVTTVENVVPLDLANISGQTIASVMNLEDITIFKNKARATGYVTFYRKTGAVGDIVIPYGTEVETTYNTATKMTVRKYYVSSSTTMGSGSSSINVPIICTEYGAIGNVPPLLINKLSTLEVSSYEVLHIDLLTVGAVQNWTGMTSIGNVMYACIDGRSIWKSIDGVTWVDLVAGDKRWSGITAVGDDVYACVLEGDIWKSTNGSAFSVFFASSNTWYGMTAKGVDIYACEISGDIWKSTNGGAFSSLNIGLQNWSGMAANSTAVYACSGGGGVRSIWKSTNGTDFVNLNAQDRNWSCITATDTEVYAGVFGGSIWKSIDGGTSFIDMVSGYQQWSGLSVAAGYLYASVLTGPIFKLIPPTPDGNISTRIAEVKNLSPISNGYVTNVKYVGDVIYIPTTTSTSTTEKSNGTEDVYRTLLKEDLLLSEEGDFSIDLKGDLVSISGVDNLAQTIRDLVKSELGYSLTYHPEYGSLINNFVGDSVDAETMQLVRVELIRTIQYDPRVESVTNFSAIFSGGVFIVKVDIIISGSKDLVRLQFKV